MKRREIIAIAVVSAIFFPTWEKRKWIFAFDEQAHGLLVTHLWECLVGVITFLYYKTRDQREKEAIEVLRIGNGPDGDPVNLRILDSGRKGIANLMKEVRGRDVKLQLYPNVPGGKAGRVVRIAKSVQVTLRAEGMVLRETKRMFINNGETVEALRHCSYSETLTWPVLWWMNFVWGKKRLLSLSKSLVEDYDDAAVRGGWQELGIRLRRTQLVLDQVDDAMHIEERDSRVYIGVLSLVMTKAYRADLSGKRPWPNGNAAKDNGAIVYTGWFSPKSELRNLLGQEPMDPSQAARVNEILKQLPRA